MSQNHLTLDLARKTKHVDYFIKGVHIKGKMFKCIIAQLHVVEHCLHLATLKNVFISTEQTQKSLTHDIAKIPMRARISLKQQIRFGKQIWCLHYSLVRRSLPARCFSHSSRVNFASEMPPGPFAAGYLWLLASALTIQHYYFPRSPSSLLNSTACGRIQLNYYA